MKNLKTIWLSFVQKVKQALAAPRATAEAIKQRHLQSSRREFEADRLDRLRNPSKYLGK